MKRQASANKEFPDRNIEMPKSVQYRLVANSKPEALQQSHMRLEARTHEVCKQHHISWRKRGQATCSTLSWNNFFVLTVATNERSC